MIDVGFHHVLDVIVSRGKPDCESVACQYGPADSESARTAAGTDR